MSVNAILVNLVSPAGGATLYFKNLHVSSGSNTQILRIPATGTNSAIKANSVVTECVWHDGDGIVSDVEWISYDGYIVFNGSCDQDCLADVIMTIGTDYVAVPSIVKDSYTETGSAITPSFIGYDSNIMTMSGDTSESEVGEYEITFSLASGYKWDDGTTEDKSVEWEIIEIPYFTFSSVSPFSLKMEDWDGGYAALWDGTIEWTNGADDWQEWDGNTIESNSEGSSLFIQLRGTGNSVITYDAEQDLGGYLYLDGNDSIECHGNIEILLDYLTVMSGEHPAMSDDCYNSMFSGCTSLTTAPELPATTLAYGCYNSMFYGCTSLTTAPELPATTLANYCYYSMFSGCTSLTTASELPATTLADCCYLNMFIDCTSLTTAPELPATTLAYGCYNNMFAGCTSLTTAPELPATTLAGDCYYTMFLNCTSLTAAPELPATTLADACYYSMFIGCTSLTTAPELPATTLASGCYNNMFIGCTSLTTAPELPATTLTISCYSGMFYGCTSLTTAPELPATTLANYCYLNMFIGCASLKVSATQDSTYQYALNTASLGGSSYANNMFSSTGGTFTGTPAANTTYYTDHPPTGAYVETIENKSSVIIRAVDQSGNEVLAGKLTVGVSPTNNMDVATKQYVDNAIGNAIGGNY